jgi:predicted negative regulator of RcsB-dependent stress response
MKSIKLTALGIFLALAGWLGFELYRSHEVNQKWEASQAELKRSYESLNEARQKQKRVAQNTQASREQAPASTPIPARTPRTQ